MNYGFSGPRPSKNGMNYGFSGPRPSKNGMNYDLSGPRPLKNDVNIDREGVGPLKNDVNIDRRRRRMSGSVMHVPTDESLLQPTGRECVSEINLNAWLLTNALAIQF